VIRIDWPANVTSFEMVGRDAVILNRPRAKRFSGQLLGEIRRIQEEARNIKNKIKIKFVEMNKKNKHEIVIGLPLYPPTSSSRNGTKVRPI